MDESMDVDIAIGTASEAKNSASLERHSSPDPPKLFGRLPSGYIYDEKMLLHRPYMDTDHPEQPERIRGIDNMLSVNGLVRRMKRLEPRSVLKEELLLVHGSDHIEKVEDIQYLSEEGIRMASLYYEYLSLYISPSTTECAKLSCGCAIEAALAVARGEVANSLAIIRPPGHHAEPSEHMGFCFFNNVAVAARVVRAKTNLKKILIVDWDVHHGNGTQKAFYDDPDVLYISLHRHDNGDFYPSGNYGDMDHCGMDKGIGRNVNIPWPTPGMGDADYLYAFMKIVLPIAYEFAPELVIVSAGFDAAAGDPVGECNVTPAGYAHMTQLLSPLAGGKMAVILEGGYNVHSNSQSCLAVARVLLGGTAPHLNPLVASEAATETIYQVSIVQSRYWKCINPKALEPSEEVQEDVITISELLKAHRMHAMFKTYKLQTIPFARESLQQSFGGQVICSRNLWDAHTLVLFVHDFGNVFAEFSSVLYCNIKTENSYIVDVSRRVVDWTIKKDWSLLDVNILAKLRVPNKKTPMPTLTEVMTYLWDNYVELTDAKRVVVISHGSATRAMVDLISSRPVTKLVKAIVQVVGMQHSPHYPRGSDDIQGWFKEVSYLAIPETHSTFLTKKAMLRSSRTSDQAFRGSDAKYR
ncbi:hypothetical protein BS47DRAFT_765446 [Hydnum rufescens UP504]|uniref:histone deacetylase n=1 Tax=Hydnum rufescens UP504 TaxID=1448309 RepID=A0A9P6E0D1_9AGAM|nr:hypothetical protein BS47DRAFT_765446 [Hydnum rufescens UP504]